MSLDKDRAFLEMAVSLSSLSTCPRRNVGCVLVDRSYRVVGSGYNGVPRGVPHCKDLACPYANYDHGSICWASHAEMNAISQCKDIDQVWTVFTTSFPCLECFKLIMNTGCKRIAFLEDYPATRSAVELLNANAIKLVDASDLVESPSSKLAARPVE